MLKALVASSGIAAGLLAATTASGQVTLWDNGGLVTGVGNGAGGRDTSVISAGFTTFGFGCNRGAALSATSQVIADDFAVGASETWSPTNLKCYAYQTGATTTAPTTVQAYVVIYNGPPGAGGTSVVFGDYTTNRIIPNGSPNGTVYTNVNRVTATTLTDNTRWIQEVSVDLTGCPDLTGGTYWAGFSTVIASGGATFAPPCSPNRIGDNGVQSVNAGAATPTWTLLNGAGGAGAGAEQDFPIKIIGTKVVGSPGTPPSSTALVLPGDGSFGSTSVTLTSGTDVKWVSVTLGSNMAADQGLDLDTEGTTIESAIAIYNSEGIRRAVDLDSGSGNRARLTGGTGLRAAVGDGLSYNSSSFTALPAGTYYIAVTSSTSATDFKLGGWQVVSAGVDSGNVTVRGRLISGQTAPVAPTSIDMPALATNGTFSTVNTTLALGEVKWIKLVISAAIGATNALDIDLETSALGPNNDAAMALYNNGGDRLAFSLQEGSGDLPMLSFGAPSATSIRPKAAITGYNYNGRNGGALGVGTYYIAVLGGDTGNFAGNFWDVTPGTLVATGNTGTLVVRARYYAAASLPTTFPDPTISHDFGTLPDGVTVSSPNIAMVKEGIIWTKFKLPSPGVSATSGVLTIDSVGSNLAPLNDTFIVCYSNFTVGSFVKGSRPVAATGMASSGDANDGPGYLSTLTFGGATRQVYAREMPRSGRDGNANLIMGLDGTNTIPAQGEYLVAILGGDFGQANASRFDASSASVNTGTVRLNIRYQSVADTQPLPPPPADYKLGPVGGWRDVVITDNIAPADTIWVSFSTSIATSAASTTTSNPFTYLDITTAGTTSQANNQGDTYIALYLGSNFDGSISGLESGLFGFDDDNGPGLTSVLSFGSAATARPADGDGIPYTGQSGDLPPGMHMLAVSMYDNATALTVAGGANYNFYSPHAINKTDNGLVIHLRSNFYCSPGDIITEGAIPLLTSGGDGAHSGTEFDAIVEVLFNLTQYPDGTYIGRISNDSGDGASLNRDVAPVGLHFDLAIQALFSGCTP